MVIPLIAGEDVACTATDAAGAVTSVPAPSTVARVRCGRVGLPISLRAIEAPTAKSEAPLPAPDTDRIDVSSVAPIRTAGARDGRGSMPVTRALARTRDSTLFAIALRTSEPPSAKFSAPEPPPANPRTNA